VQVAVLLLWDANLHEERANVQWDSADLVAGEFEAVWLSQEDILSSTGEYVRC
jgi:hypothetical protein